jgi:predicted RNA methylase
MSDPAAKQAHVWARDDLDWYVEPEDCTTALLGVERFRGAIWDPCCGRGNIVRAITKACGPRNMVIATDLVNRGWDADGWGWYGERDFLAAPASDVQADNIIMNPPFGRGLKAEAFIRHALAHPTLAKLAVFLDMKFLASNGRARGLYAEHPPSRVYILAPRPSCPPGAYLAAGNRAGGGTADWCWVVWDQTAPPTPTTMHWLLRPALPGLSARSPNQAQVAA